MNQKFKFRSIQDADYETLCEWWESWGWKPVPRCFLPGGYIVEDDDDPLYACFVYMTGTGICWLEWILSNKRVDPWRKRGAKEYMVHEVEKILRATGIKAIFTTSKDTGLVNGLKKCGFEVSETGMVQLIKILK